MTNERHYSGTGRRKSAVPRIVFLKIFPDFRADALERRASIRTRKGRSSTLNLRIVLSENRIRFSGRCGRPPRRRRQWLVLMKFLAVANTAASSDRQPCKSSRGKR